MKAIEKISAELFDKLKSRFENINLGDKKADDTIDPEEARFFSFDYTQGKNDFGTVTITIADKKGLKVFYSKNITEDEDLDKKRWYKFLKGLRHFARRNMMTFDARDINKKTLDIRDLKTFAKTHAAEDDLDSITESKMYGNPKRSYQKMNEGVRIVVIHNKPIDESVHGARSRNIARIYIENAQGERFLLPENSLLGARVVARHIANGGAIHDSFSSHIFEAIGQLRDLRYFVNTSRRQQFEDATTTEIVEAAVEYYNTLKETLQKLKGQRGYNNYMESFEDIIRKEQVEVNEELKGRFIKRTFDQRLESAMPLIAKAYEHKIREAANLLKKVDEFVQGSKRFGLNESDKEMLSLIEFKDSTAFVVKMLEHVSTKLAEHDTVLSKFARNMMENWHGATPTHRSMASKLVRSYIKEMRSLVREDEEDMPLDEKKSAEFLKLLSKPLKAGPDGSVSADLSRVFNDEKLNDAIRSLSRQPHGIDRDARPLVIVRFLEIAGDPGGKEFELDELHFVSDILNQLKTNEIGKKYADKIDLILKKYPASNEPETVEPEQPEAPEQQTQPAAQQPAAPPAPPAPGQPPQPPVAP